MSQLVHPFHLLHSFQSLHPIITCYKLNWELVIPLIVKTIVHCFSSRHIFYSRQTLLLIALRMNSESCEIYFFYFTNDVRRLTDFIGSTTNATKGSALLWKSYCVLTSIPESQHPKLGWEWYHPTISCVLILLNH
jgi:hypothetical protein